ncbi:MAG: hypothetical protein ACRC6U_09080 [Fusobacteriaceae bacterium]
MKKILIGLFILGTMATACELDGMVGYFRSQSFIQVGEGEVLVKDMRWWNKMSYEQKERFGNMFRNHSKEHMKEYNYLTISKIRNNFTGDILAEFKISSNKIEVKTKQ